MAPLLAAWCVATAQVHASPDCVCTPSCDVSTLSWILSMCVLSLIGILWYVTHVGLARVLHIFVYLWCFFSESRLWVLPFLSPAFRAAHLTVF